MEPLLVLHDEDIFSNPAAPPKFYKLRPTSKGIIFDAEGNIALLAARGHALFPGGGIKNGETPEQALVRECKEEIGCNVVLTGYIGWYEQYRAHQAKKYEVHFFVAQVIGEKGSPTTTEASEMETEIIWATKEEVLRILEEQLDDVPEEEYALTFNSVTHFDAFQKFLEKHPL